MKYINFSSFDCLLARYLRRLPTVIWSGRHSLQDVFPRPNFRAMSSAGGSVEERTPAFLKTADPASEINRPMEGKIK
jgi:hypothetical protein